MRLNELTGPSTDWLVTSRGRMRRRAGSTIYGDTLTAGVETAGILETAIGFLARRMLAALLASMTDLFPTPLLLFTEEATKGAGTIAYYSTNDSAWHVLGDGFDGTSYPASGRVAHRVVPMVYENEYGGLTLHRLNTATDRQYACAGSRSLLEAQKQICWGGATSAAMGWNGRSGTVGATEADDDCLEVFPLGLIPPLQMPVCSKGGASSGSSGPFKGSEAWFYTQLFEDENGELSMFPVPRPPGSAWDGYEGFGYFQVDSAAPTQFYDSVVYSGIAVGGPRIRRVHLARSTKVDVATTGAGAVVAPSLKDLYIFATVPNGVTTYVDSDGNDLALDTDSRVSDLYRGGGVQWAPRARNIGRFDGHTTLSDLRPIPYALIAAPWENGAINATIGDDSLYDTVYAVAVTPDYLLLRKVGSANITKVGATLHTAANPAVIGLPDLRNVEVGKAISGTGIPGGTTISSIAHLIDAGCATTDGSVTVTVTDSTLLRIGQLVEGPGIPAGAVVVTKPAGTSITISLPATVTDASCTLRFTQATMSASATATNTGVTFTIAADHADDAVPLAGETLRSLVDRVNADASITNTTFTGATWSVSGAIFGIGVIDLNAAPTGVYVGDRVISAAFPSDTVVTAIETGGLPAQHIAVSRAPTRANTGASEAVTTQHRAASTDIQYALGVVPGADADEQADHLLRTRVQAHATYGNADTTLALLDPALAEYVTPGMKASGTNLPATAVVTAVNTSTGIVTIAPASTGTGTDELVTFYYDTGDETAADGKGFVRMFGNAFPALLPWNRGYLDRFKPVPHAMIFTAASPGYAQDGIHTWRVRNRRSDGSAFGPIMGQADLGPFELHFHARGRMRLGNPRTGETHHDDDYTKVAVSWSVGSRSPYAICAGTGVAIALGDEGLYATAGGMGDERFFSGAVYDAEAAPGRRGALEYAIGQCILASESGSDGYKLAASLEGSVLYVRYFKDANSTRFDRELRYDFSEGQHERQGMDALFRADGTPYPWSAPLTLAPSCSASVPTAAGVKRFGAFDTNAGTADGRVDQIDTGTKDNGTAVVPRGYTGTLVPEGMEQLQPLRIGVVARKAGTGIVVGVAQDSRPDHDEMAWDDVQMPTTGPYEYGREVLLIAAGGRRVRDALTLRITDDGTGECPEISRLTLYGDEKDTIHGKGKGG